MQRRTLRTDSRIVGRPYWPGDCLVSRTTSLPAAIVRSTGPSGISEQDHRRRGPAERQTRGSSRFQAERRSPALWPTNRLPPAGRRCTPERPTRLAAATEAIGLSRTSSPLQACAKGYPRTSFSAEVNARQACSNRGTSARWVDLGGWLSVVVPESMTGPPPRLLWQAVWMGHLDDECDVPSLDLRRRERHAYRVSRQVDVLFFRGRDSEGE